MRLYYADIRGMDERDALYPPLSKSRGSAFGVSLLAAAYEDYAGAPLPKIIKLLSGKPHMPDRPEFHYSVSHSKTHVFVALSKQPVGADTETHRAMKQTVIEKLTTPAELAGLTFFDIWVLRESYFKLTQKGDLRALRFYRRNGRIVPPEEGVHCRLYPDIEGSSTAVCSYDGRFPDKITKIPIEALLKKDALKRLEKEKKTAKHEN
jgi:phosphopantetheinyl transferase